MWSSSFGARTLLYMLCCVGRWPFIKAHNTLDCEKRFRIDKREKSNEWRCDAGIKIEADSRQESHFSDTKTSSYRISLFSVHTRTAYFSARVHYVCSSVLRLPHSISVCVCVVHTFLCCKIIVKSNVLSPTNCGWCDCVSVCVPTHIDGIISTRLVSGAQTSKSVIKSMKFANEWKSIHIGRHHAWRSHRLGVGQRTQLWCDWNESNTCYSRPLSPSLSYFVTRKIIPLRARTVKMLEMCKKLFLLIFNARCECHADGRHTKPPIIQQRNVFHFLFAVIFYNWLTVGFIYLISNNSIHPWVQHSARTHKHTHREFRISSLIFQTRVFEWNWRAQAHFLVYMQGRAIHAIFFNISTENWISHTLLESFFPYDFFPNFSVPIFRRSLLFSWDDAAGRSLMHSPHNANSIIIYYFMS